MIDLTKERPLTVKKAAEFLCVHPHSVRRYFKQGLEHVIVGGRIYTTREAIQRFARKGGCKGCRNVDEYRAGSDFLDSLGV